jgi:hypothetical protein
MIIEENAGLIRCCGPCPEVTGNAELAEGVLEYMCSGRLCAGWRWVYVPNPDFVENQLHYPNQRSIPTYIKSDTEGYCGLAGRP